MQQLAFGKGNFADSLFHNAVCFPCAVIVRYSSPFLNIFIIICINAVITLIKFMAYKLFNLLNPFIVKINPFGKPV